MCAHMHVCLTLPATCPSPQAGAIIQANGAIQPDDKNTVTSSSLSSFVDAKTKFGSTPLLFAVKNSHGCVA